jgi:hypothetical protein
VAERNVEGGVESIGFEVCFDIVVYLINGR